MKFKNPWVDPRVTQVRSADAQAYLLRRGWKALPPDQSHLLPFEGPGPDEDPPVLYLPLLEQARDYPQPVIELITDLAVAEDRYAVEVLNDILQPRTGDGSADNGGAGQVPRPTASQGVA